MKDQNATGYDLLDRKIYWKIENLPLDRRPERIYQL